MTLLGTAAALLSSVILKLDLESKPHSEMGEVRAEPSLSAQAPGWEQHLWDTSGVPVLPCLHQLPFFKLMADGHEKYSKSLN